MHRYSYGKTAFVQGAVCKTNCYWAPAGELSLEGRKDGFLDARRSITVEAGAERSVELVLRPVARKGFLVLSVSIVGARVFLDDMEVGVTPLAPMAIQAIMC